ncbi:hypothetical protein GDO78_022402 [Eleutherodactylus coqui]|uniref:Uncharacterized protein n=1 Tax=Eleutherodactylus coqui TaxID=57060 RepID=A0A8J6JXJ7_ELECQ|nr:hypothetical protein GDO78_022402 [Eleutherodactylus coqui]
MGVNNRKMGLCLKKKMHRNPQKSHGYQVQHVKIFLKIYMMHGASAQRRKLRCVDTAKVAITGIGEFVPGSAPGRRVNL